MQSPDQLNLYQDSVPISVLSESGSTRKGENYRPDLGLFLSPCGQNLDLRERGRTLIAWCRWSVKIVSGGTVPVNTDNRCPQTRFFSISSPAASRPLSLTCKSTQKNLAASRRGLSLCPYVPISCRTPRPLKKTMGSWAVLHRGDENHLPRLPRGGVESPKMSGGDSPGGGC